MHEVSHWVHIVTVVGRLVMSRHCFIASRLTGPLRVHTNPIGTVIEGYIVITGAICTKVVTADHCQIIPLLWHSKILCAT